jgi:hypothetical protein
MLRHPNPQGIQPRLLQMPVAVATDYVYKSVDSQRDSET